MFMCPLRTKADKLLEDLIQGSLKQMSVQNSWRYGCTSTDPGFYASGMFGVKKLVVSRPSTSDEYYIGFPYTADEQRKEFSLRSLDSIDGVENLVKDVFELVSKMIGNDMELYNELMTDLNLKQESMKANVRLNQELGGGLEDASEALRLDILNIKNRILSETNLLFARKCDWTGTGINAGFVIDDGEMHLKNESDALEQAKLAGYKNLEHSYDSGYHCYTEWEDFDDMQYIIKNGQLCELEAV